MIIEPFRDNFLSFFSQSADPFMIYSGRLYTISKKSKSNISINYNGLSWPLIPSLKLNQLENDLFDEKSEQIHELVEIELQKRNKTLDNLVNEKNNLIKRLQNHQSESFSQFLMIDVYNSFFNQSQIDVDQFDQKRIEIKPKSNSLDNIIDGIGIFVLNRQCYKIESDTVINKKFGYISNKGINFSLKPWISLERLSNLYVHSLANQMEKIVSDYNLNNKEIIDNLKEENSQLRSNERDLKKLSEVNEYQRNNLAFRKLGQHTYRLWYHHDKYLIKRGDVYRVFNEVDVGLNINFVDGSFKPTSLPIVFTKNYSHPFFGANGQTCWAGTDWSNVDLNIDQTFNLKDKEKAARIIANALLKGRNALRKPYSSDASYIHHDISRFKHNIVAYSHNEAKAYLQRNGMNKDYIFDNSGENDIKK